MSATSKRDRALRDGVEPVTGKELFNPSVADQAPPEPTVQESDDGATEAPVQEDS